MQTGIHFSAIIIVKIYVYIKLIIIISSLKTNKNIFFAYTLMLLFLPHLARILVQYQPIYSISAWLCFFPYYIILWKIFFWVHIRSIHMCVHKLFSTKWKPWKIACASPITKCFPEISLNSHKNMFFKISKLFLYLFSFRNDPFSIFSSKQIGVCVRLFSKNNTFLLSICLTTTLLFSSRTDSMMQYIQAIIMLFH